MLRWWHWVFVVGAVMFWWPGPELATEGRHFGHQMWWVFGVLFLVFLSPFFAIPSVIINCVRFRRGQVTGKALFARLAWALTMIVNVILVIWVVNYKK